MKRMTLLLTGVLTFSGIALSASLTTADDDEKDRGRNVSVSFGQWDPNDPDLLPAEKPLDRLLADPGMGRGNNHLLIPQTATIKEGGTVSYIISGGHVVAVYDDGHQPEDINTINIEQDNPATPVNEACATTAGGILSDSNKRIYRGPCFVGRRDGVEVVQFSKPGTYLVICARKDHFFNPTTQEFEMFGFVEVKKARNKD